MTKAEVQSNIRYNENLVAQYQRKLNSLNQQLSSLNATARQLESQNQDLIRRKQKLESEMGELARLKQKLQGLQNDFSSKQTKRVNGYNKNITQVFSVNFFSSYIDGMKMLLSGSEYRNTYNGLTSALEKVSKKTQEKQREIDSVTNQINGVRSKIDSTNREISTCRNNIGQTNNDLAYRKKRIQYWKDQLKYAT